MDNTDNKYICDKCNYLTDTYKYFYQHCKTKKHLELEKKPRKDKLGIEYKCDKCEYISMNKNNYLTHKLNNHSATEEREKQFTYYCKACDFGVFVDSCYNKHIISKNHLMRIK